MYRPSTGSWYILPSSNPVYPYFGPYIIQQPKLPLPPLTGGPPAVAVPPAPAAAAPAAVGAVPPLAAAVTP